MLVRCQFVVVALLLTSSCTRAAELVLVWNDLTLRAIRYANMPPPTAVRHMAIVHLAMFDTLDGLQNRYLPYLVTNAAPQECSREASLSAAAYHTLRTLFPKSADLLDSHQNAVLAAIPNDAAKTNGIQWGKSVAAQYLKLRQFDGAGQSAGYSYVDQAGSWKKTPPNYDKPLLPAWGRMKPFAIQSAEQFRAQAPPLLNSSEWATEFKEVKRIGATNSTARTPQQREIALFWADGPRTETPPGHWNKIA